jgi:hypothetical protein
LTYNIISFRLKAKAEDRKLYFGSVMFVGMVAAPESCFHACEEAAFLEACHVWFL